MAITGDQIRMARAALKLGVRDLAKLAEVSPNTVTRLEAGYPANSATLRVIQSALEAAGVEFIPENGGGAGVRLRHRTQDQL
jgi:transcriptional regulator with XRE-family HTH domain